MPYVYIAGIKLYYEEFGSGEPIIMLHGWNENGRIFKNQIEFFSQKGYKVYTLDMRGHGKSSKPRFGYTFYRMVNDVYYFTKKIEINNPIIIAHSMGGMVAMKYYLKYNNCKSLVLISSPCIIPIQMSGIIKLGGDYLLKKLRSGLKFASEMMLKNLQKGLEINELNDMEQKYKFDYRDFQVPLYVTISLAINSLSYNVKYKLKDFNIPVLIIAGEKDDLIPISLFENMEKEMPNCILKKFENCGHFSFIEEPIKTNEIILDFLKSYSG
ncbi:MAG: alpha/beta fold hydrolase [Candidatus Helarchaeota archaeon]